MNTLAKKYLLFIFLLITILLIPLLTGTYFTYLMNLAGIFIIVSIGLNILTGNAGQISLGHAAFFAIGAYSSSYITLQFKFPFLLAMPISGIITAIIGFILGIPALKLIGLYLAMVTLSFSYITEECIIFLKEITGGSAGLSVPRPTILGLIINDDVKYFYLIYAIVIILTLVAFNIMRSKTGRAFRAILDNEVAAQSMGISLAKYKTTAFVISAFYTGIAGSLYAHLINFISPDNFNIMVSIKFLVMIIIGGLGSILGSFLGALFMTFLPEFIRWIKDLSPVSFGQYADIQLVFYGVIIISFLRFMPIGISGMIKNTKIFQFIWK